MRTMLGENLARLPESGVVGSPSELHVELPPRAREDIYALVNCAIGAVQRVLDGGSFDGANFGRELRRFNPSFDDSTLIQYGRENPVGAATVALNECILSLGYACGIQIANSTCQPVLLRFNPKEIEAMSLQKGGTCWIAECVFLKCAPRTMALALDYFIFIDFDGARQSSEAQITGLIDHLGPNSRLLFASIGSTNGLQSLVEEFGPRRLLFEELGHLTDERHLKEHKATHLIDLTCLFAPSSQVFSNLRALPDSYLAIAAAHEFSAHLRGASQQIEDLIKTGKHQLAIDLSLLFAFSWSNGAETVSTDISPEYKVALQQVCESYQRNFGISLFDEIFGLALSNAKAGGTTLSQVVTTISSRFMELVKCELSEH